MGGEGSIRNVMFFAKSHEDDTAAKVINNIGKIIHPIVNLIRWKLFVIHYIVGK